MRTSTAKLGLIALPILVALGLTACAGDNTMSTSMNQDRLVSSSKSSSVAAATDVNSIADTTTQESNTTTQREPDTIADTSSDVTKMGPTLPSKPEKDVIFFAFDQSSLSDADIALLKSHAEYLVAHPDVDININGHTDSHGPKVYNNYLSRKRAEKVAAVLIADGVDPQQIHTQGFADDQPNVMAQNDQQQRRVELVYPANVVAALN